MLRVKTEEYFVLVALVSGYTSRQIAAQLGVSRQTVERRLGMMYSRNHIHGRRPNVTLAIEYVKDGRRVEMINSEEGER